jgi:hypothetical protein
MGLGTQALELDQNDGPKFPDMQAAASLSLTVVFAEHTDLGATGGHLGHCMA